MKKIVHIVMKSITACAVCVLVSCSNDSDGGHSETASDKLFKKNPVTIQWDNSSEKNIDSFTADVSVYSMNSRTDSALSLQNTYRMSVKTTGGIAYSRIDFDAAYGEPRAFLTDGDEMIIVHTGSDEIEMRLTVSNETTKKLAFLETENAFSRVNLDKIRTEAKRLSFDVAEESDSNCLCISVPSSFFTEEERLSTKIMFDSASETLNSVEIVTVDKDGTKITSVMNPVYEDIDGTPVRIGSITTIETVVTDLVDGFDEEYDVINSIEELPELSDEDFEAMQESGAIFENNTITFGDPANLSNTETVVEVYNNIEINTLDNSLFKLIMKD